MIKLVIGILIGFIIYGRLGCINSFSDRIKMAEWENKRGDK